MIIKDRKLSTKFSQLAKKLFIYKTNPFSLELIGDKEVIRNFGFPSARE